MARPVPFLIRPARATDKAAVLAFCSRTFDWGDYLPEVWDEWLADPQGQLLVATLGEVPVGVAKVTLLTPTEAWLEGLRVDERYRGHGLGWQFQVRCLQVAHELGADVARLATHSKNLPVHTMTERSGMRHVASACCLVAPALPSSEDAASLVSLALQDWPQVVTRILHGPTLAEMHGLYGAGWTWETLTEARLRAHLERGQVLALQDDRGTTTAAAIVMDIEPRWKLVPVGYVDGSGAHAKALARGLRRHAASLCLDKVEAMISVSPELREAFGQAGYENDIEADVAIRIYEMDWKGATL